MTKETRESVDGDLEGGSASSGRRRDCWDAAILREGRARAVQVKERRKADVDSPMFAPETGIRVNIWPHDAGT